MIFVICTYMLGLSSFSYDRSYMDTSESDSETELETEEEEEEEY